MELYICSYRDSWHNVSRTARESAFHTDNPDSNPGGCQMEFVVHKDGKLCEVAQMVKFETRIGEVPGSNPVVGGQSNFFFLWFPPVPEINKIPD